MSKGGSKEGPTAPRFRHFGEWYAYLRSRHGQAIPLNELRMASYVRIEELRGRPLLVYASAFLNNQLPRQAPIFIDHSDIDGFTDLVGCIPSEEKKVDVLLLSPGGSAEATERIVELLRERFDEVDFLVPHSAFSAATMMALSGNKIILHPSASLGPIDPQINNRPARSIQRGFQNVRDLLKKEGPDALPAYIPLIEKYTLELLEICQDSLDLSKELAGLWLGRYMFGGDAEAQDRIDAAVEYFSSYDEHKSHGRPLPYAKLSRLNLRIEKAEDPLAGALRESHILLTAFFGLTPFVKVYEIASGLSWGRQLGSAPVEPSRPPEDAPPVEPPEGSSC